MASTSFFLAAFYLSGIFPRLAMADSRPEFQSTLDQVRQSVGIQSGKFIEIGNGIIHSSSSVHDVTDAKNDLQIVETFCAPGTVIVSTRFFYCFVK